MQINIISAYLKNVLKQYKLSFFIKTNWIKKISLQTFKKLK